MTLTTVLLTECGYPDRVQFRRNRATEKRVAEGEDRLTQSADHAGMSSSPSCFAWVRSHSACQRTGGWSHRRGMVGQGMGRANDSRAPLQQGRVFRVRLPSNAATRLSTRRSVIISAVDGQGHVQDSFTSRCSLHSPGKKNTRLYLYPGKNTLGYFYPLQKFTGGKEINWMVFTGVDKIF